MINPSIALSCEKCWLRLHTSSFHLLNLMWANDQWLFSGNWGTNGLPLGWDLQLQRTLRKYQQNKVYRDAFMQFLIIFNLDTDVLFIQIECLRLCMYLFPLACLIASHPTKVPTSIIHSSIEPFAFCCTEIAWSSPSVYSVHANLLVACFFVNIL